MLFFSQIYFIFSFCCCCCFVLLLIAKPQFWCLLLVLRIKNWSAGIASGAQGVGLDWGRHWSWSWSWAHSASPLPLPLPIPVTNHVPFDCFGFWFLEFLEFFFLSFSLFYSIIFVIVAVVVPALCIVRLLSDFNCCCCLGTATAPTIRRRRRRLHLETEKKIEKKIG